MAKTEILICDICKTEQRSDIDVHWSMRFGGPCTIDLKNQPGCQYEKRFEVLCRPCAERIKTSVMEAINNKFQCESEHGVSDGIEGDKGDE